MSIDLQDRSSAKQQARVIRRRLPLWQPEAPKHPVLMALYRYWMSLRDGDLIPSRRDFDLPRGIPVAGTITLAELAVSEIDEFHQGSDGEPHDEMVRQDYLAARDIGVPLYHEVAAVSDDATHSYARLILPFASDNRNVDELMVCSVHQEFADLIKLLN